MKHSHYKTLARPVEGVIFKEKKSKFLGFAYPIENEIQIEQYLNELRRHHAKANHVCYGWQLGVEPMRWRAHDDGEPNNSAGLPIYGQIQAYELTDILLAVVRYFGGTKLGVGGLISAYKKTAQITLEEGQIATRILYQDVVIEFDYASINKVMRLIKLYEIDILSQSNAIRPRYELGIPRKNANKAVGHFRDIQGVSVQTKSK